MKTKIIAVVLATFGFSGMAKADDELNLKLSYIPGAYYFWASPNNVLSVYDVAAFGVGNLKAALDSEDTMIGRASEMAVDGLLAFHLSGAGHEYWGHAEAFYEITGYQSWVTLGFFDNNSKWRGQSGAFEDNVALAKLLREDGDTIMANAGINFQSRLSEMALKRSVGKELLVRDALLRIPDNLELLTYVIATPWPGQLGKFTEKVDEGYDPAVMILNLTGPYYDLFQAKIFQTKDGDWHAVPFSKRLNSERLERGKELYSQLLLGGAWQAFGSWVDLLAAGNYFFFGDQLDMPRTWVNPETTLTPYGVEFDLLLSTLDFPGLEGKAIHFLAGGGESFSSKAQYLLRAKIDVEGLKVPKLNTSIGLGVEYFRNSFQGFAFRAEAIQPITKNFGLGIEAQVKPFKGYSPDFYTLPSQELSQRYTVFGNIKF